MALSAPALHRLLTARLAPLAAILLASGLMAGASACAPVASPDAPVGGASAGASASAAGNVADGADGGPLTASAASPELVRYTVRFVDQNARPVPGVTLQVCNDTFCQLFVSDEAGACIFELEPRTWDAHTLSAPVGYAINDKGAYVLPETGGELVIELTELPEGTE